MPEDVKMNDVDERCKTDFLTVSTGAPRYGNHGIPHPGALLLAILATITSLGIAGLAGSQRGGSVPEQLTCIAWAVLAVLCTHLLPTLCRMASGLLHLVAAPLWVISLVVVLCGQMSVFLMAQQHAGDRREDAVPALATFPVSAALSGRSLTAITEDQAKTQIALATVDSRHCTVDCTATHLHRVVLAERLDVLTTEADEAKRHEAEVDRQKVLADRAMRLRDGLRVDPVNGRLASWLGVDVERLNLLLALACATVLDGMASLCWYAAFASRRAGSTAQATRVVVPGGESRLQNSDVTDAVVVAVPSGNRAAELGSEPAGQVATPPDTDAALDIWLVRLVRDVAAGKLRPTVDEIRRYYRCAQATAVMLRREYEAFRLSLQS